MERLKTTLYCCLAFILFPLLGFSQKVALDAKMGEIIVKGKIGSLNKPQQLWIYMGDEKWDSIPVKDGKFEYKKTTMLPAYGALMIKYKPYYKGIEGNSNFFGDMDLKSLFFEAGTLTVNSEIDSLKSHAVFTGSKIQDEQESYLSKKRMVSALEREVAAAFNSATPEQLQSAAFIANYEKQTEVVQRRSDSLMSVQIKMRPNSLVSQIAFFTHLRANENTLPPEKARVMFELFDISFKESEAGKNALKVIESLGKPKEVIKIPAVGQQAPVFSQSTVVGKAVSLNDFQGKYVLIDFWASWCVPCRKVNPDLVKVHAKFRDQAFTILGVSLDEDKEKWQKAIADDKLDWTHVSDLKGWNNEAAKLYGIQGIPQNILVDPSGRIVGKNLTIAQMESTLQELFKATESR